MIKIKINENSSFLLFALACILNYIIWKMRTRKVHIKENEYFMKKIESLNI